MDLASGDRPKAFVVRVQRGGGGVRGQVVAIASGASRLFADLREAIAFIEAQLGERDTPGGDRGPSAP